MNTPEHDAIAQTPSLLAPTWETISATAMIAPAANRSDTDPCLAR